MKRLFISTLLVITFGCGQQQTTPNTNNSNAIAIIKSDTNIYIILAEKKLGTLYAGEKIEGTLEFENKTNTPITIGELKGSCGCMIITESFDRMEEGEIKRLKYVIDTSGKSDEEYFDIIMTTSQGRYVVELSANIKQNIN